MANKRTAVKVLVGLIGTILVGAIGSGVWQHLLEPSLFFMRDAVLNLAVLGTTKFKNDIYMEVARGLHEAHSLQVYSIFLSFLAWALVISGLWIFTKSKDLRKRQTKLLSDLEAHIKGQDPDRKSFDEMRQEVITTPIKRLIWVARFNMAVVIFFSAALVVAQVRAEYINSSISHFEHMLMITKPYMNATKVYVLRSQFAQIRNKPDYVLIIKNLERIADEKELRRPTFNPW